MRRSWRVGSHSHDCRFVQGPTVGLLDGKDGKRIDFFFKVDLTGISWIFLGFPKVSQQNFLDLDAVKNGLLYPMISDQWWIFRTMFENTGGYPPRDRKCRIVLSDMGLRLVDNLPVLFAIGNP